MYGKAKNAIFNKFKRFLDLKCESYVEYSPDLGESACHGAIL